MALGISLHSLKDYEWRRKTALVNNSILETQLNALNLRWNEAVNSIEHWSTLFSRGIVPRHFSSLEEYIKSVPLMTKADIQSGQMSYKHPRPNTFRITGGSTAEPIQVPSWKDEYSHTRMDPWLGRHWLGIHPNDKMFLFWGHAHLLGSGWRGRLNAVVRLLKDRVQGYERVSCYDLTEERLRAVGDKLVSSSANFVVGYSHALDALARVNSDRADKFHAKKFKAIIAAAEGLPMEDSRSVIETTFGTKLAMEYGSVETNLIAHSNNEDTYDVFWNNYMLEFKPENSYSDISEVLVTSLYPRCTPLFRYSIGDKFRLGSGECVGPSVISFADVIGRSNSFVKVPGGPKLHSEVFSHLVRDIQCINAYQIVSTPSTLFLDLVTEKPGIDSVIEAQIMAKAERASPGLSSVMQIREVSTLHKSIAGKLPMVVHMSDKVL